LFFRQLFEEHFPGSSAAKMEDECKWTLKSMKDSLTRAAEDGVLFAHGNAGRFGSNHRVVVGEGSVRRSESRELLQEFGADNLDGLDLYATCYEWTHWSVVLSALG